MARTARAIEADMVYYMLNRGNGRMRLFHKAEDFEAFEWQWSGLWRRAHRSPELPLSEWPLKRSRNWVAWVNRGLNDDRLEELRASVQRGRPLGTDAWVRQTAARLGLEFTLRGPGRPRTNPDIQ